LELLRATFADAGYAVVAAMSAPAALQALAGQQVNCILTDSLRFRAEDQTLRDLRRVVAGAGPTPVVLLTAYEEAARWVPSQLGLTAILLKPIDLDELLAFIATILHRSASGVLRRRGRTGPQAEKTLALTAS
jgi:CheY-like chemotaxis protein